MYAYSPEARGRSERAFGTRQGRLSQERVLAGITDMETANHYLQEVYRPASNTEFSQLAPEDGSAFVEWVSGNLTATCVNNTRVRSVLTTVCDSRH